MERHTHTSRLRIPLTFFVFVSLTGVFVFSRWTDFGASLRPLAVRFTTGIGIWNGLVGPKTEIDVRPGIANVTSDLFSRLEVKTTGDFTERIRQFNDALMTIRRDALQQRRGLTGEWRSDIDPKAMTVIDGAKDDFMSDLKICSRITTIVLPWKNQTEVPWNSLKDFANILYQVYYEWTADNTLCTWIETPGVIKLKADVLFNWTCNRNVNDTVKPSSLALTFLNGKPLTPGVYWPNDGKTYPAHFYTHPPPFVTYMFIHTDAVVTDLGDVFTQNCKLILYACSHEMNPTLPAEVDKLPLYDEIFVIYISILGHGSLPSYGRNYAENCTSHGVSEV